MQKKTFNNIAIVKKAWVKPHVSSLKNEELSKYIKAAARSGCTGGFGR